MPEFSIYECDPIRPGMPPQNERTIASGFSSAIDAMIVANEMKRANPRKSYTVGES